MSAADGKGGIIPRALEVLFDRLEEVEAAAPGSTTAAISYIEIYNEKIHDLLQPFKLDVKQTFRVCLILLRPAHQSCRGFASPEHCPALVSNAANAHVAPLQNPLQLKSSNISRGHLAVNDADVAHRMLKQLGMAVDMSAVHFATCHVP